MSGSNMRKSFLVITALLCVIFSNSLALAGEEKDDKPQVSREEIRKLCRKLRPCS